MLLFALLNPPNETEEGRSPNANKKSDVRSSERRTFTVPVLYCFPARRVEVARHPETSSTERYFGDKKTHSR